MKLKLPLKKIKFCKKLVFKRKLELNFARIEFTVFRQKNIFAVAVLPETNKGH